MRGLMMGRFQPFHLGHLELVKQILSECDEVIIALTGSQFNYIQKDPFTAREIIKSLKKIGKTIFMSSHLLGETKEVCDKVALLDKGNLLKYVTVSDVEKISKNFRIEIEFTESPTQSQLTSVLKIMDIKNVKQKSEHIIIVEFEGGLEQRAELLKQIQNLALKVITFRTIDYDLEALYLDLVSESVR